MLENADEIQQLQFEIKNLRELLRVKEQKLFKLQYRNAAKNKYSSQLSTNEICRYSRQMLVPQISIDGQVTLKKSKVLIVGIGGLGCPSSLYLAAAGIGELTLVDNDVVELTNLHRQVLHSESDLNNPKVVSAQNKLKGLNNQIEVIPLQLHADSKTLATLISNNKYNVILDCTDNVATRYLLNDVAVLNRIPLVSGSALQLEGQLTVYNYKKGPCYRCLFLKPPPPETVTSCGDGGVLGAVPGTIGLLQALETIKILTDMPGVLSGRLLTFDGTDTTFRNIKLRPRNVNCAICGDNPSIASLIDYEQFCGAKAHDKVENINILKENETMHVQDLFNNREDPFILDVRPKIEYDMCALPGSINFPFIDIVKGRNLGELQRIIDEHKDGKEVYIVCRRGNDSQRAISHLKRIVGVPVKFVNITGGLHSFAKYVDSEFPVY